MLSGFRLALLILSGLLVGTASARAQDAFDAGGADMNTRPDTALRCAELLSRNLENPDYRSPPECRANVRRIEDQARDLQRQYVTGGISSGGISAVGDILPLDDDAGDVGNADRNARSDTALRCAELLSRNLGNPDYRSPPECRANARRIED